MGDYDLLVKITGDASNLISALGKASSNVSDFSKGIDKIGKGMTIVGGAVTAAFALIIKKTVDVGDAFNDMSLRTGVAVEELSALAYAGKQTGTDIEAIELSLKFLTRAMDDTSKGIGTAKDTFAALGISVTDAEGKLRPTVEVMKDVATAVAAIDDPARQAAVAMELFGARSGTQLVPLLKLGEKGIDDLMKKAEELGIVLSTKEAQAADEFKDKMNDLKDVLGAAGRDIANVLIPSLTALSIKAVEIIKKIREWAEEHKTLIDWIVKLGAGLGVLAAVGGPILLAVSAFTKMQGAITALGTISSGPIGIAIIAIAGIAVGSKLLYDRLEETVGGMREFREELKNMSLFQLNLEIQKLTDSAEQLQKRFSEIPKGIGQQEILTMIDGINKRLKLLYERKDEIDNLSTSISGFGEQLEITGGKIETFDEMVARMAEETKVANEAIAKSTQDLANIMQPTYDKLYEMSHTAEEVAVRSLNAQRDAQTEAVKALNLSTDAQAAALTKISELYNIEVGLIISKLEEEKQKQIEVAIITEKSWEAVGVVTRKIRGEYDPLIDKLKELATETESSAARQVKAMQTIIDAAGKVTAIKLPGGGIISTEAITAPNVGAEYYAPKLQVGTPLVTKTGLAVIHKDEAVLTPEQNKAYQSGGSQFTVNINNPIIRNDDDITKIRNEVKRAHEELVRQYGRTGYAPAY
jgi:methyl-accepting chemotaxis protein